MAAKHDQTSPSRGLNIQLNLAVHDLKATLQGLNTGSSKTTSSESSMFDSNSTLLRDLSKIQKELENIARHENQRLGMVPQRQAATDSPLVSAASKHRRRRSLLDDDTTLFDDGATYVDSDTDIGLATPASIDFDTLGGGKPLPTQDQEPSEIRDALEPSFAEGIQQIRRGCAVLISATSRNHRALLFSALVLGLALICLVLS